ncbi:MAG: hypothetical protein JSV03_00015 [Planctomycetota bacterium]|nr:MAG: hypothetical protein JSV03_00015 [Planctomycetota bacterium]
MAPKVLMADNISKDTFINIMAQYRPAHKVGEVTIDEHGKQSIRFEKINRSPNYHEMNQAYQSARDIGLWRFDKE